MRDPILPDYENPPAQETWMSFQFASLKWEIPHFGAFWNEVRSDYPEFEVHPPVGEFQLELTNQLNAKVAFPVRCWFINFEGNRLLQVQRDRFFQNWRKPNPTAPYLHYGDLKPTFEKEWKRFCDFAARYQVGIPNVLLCEVCYINHLERGAGWNNFSDLELIFPSICAPKGRGFLGKAETATISGSYVMPSHEGRLRISIEPAVRQVDGKEIIQLTITGSCRPISRDPSELSTCLDLCREWVVRGFDDITSKEMHKIWGKKNG